MPLSPYEQPRVLDALLGSTTLGPATVYVGLLSQLATTATTALTAGTAYTAITCSATAFAVAAGDAIAVGTGASRQIVVASGAAAQGATSIPVNSFVATTAWAVGSSLTLLKSTSEPSGSGYARVAVTNNSTNWPAATGSNPASKSNGTAITFAQLTGNLGTQGGFALFDAATTGNMMAADVLNTAQAFSTGNTPSFPANSLTASAF